MKKIEIVKYPDERLLQKSIECDSIPDEKLLDQMFASLKSWYVGLAAPQIGINKRFFIMKYPIGSDNWKRLVVVNPKILRKSKKLEVSEEGCLSINCGERSYEIARHEKITVSFTDENNKEHFLTLKDFPARIFQHEFDHLEGVLINNK